jgi:ATP-binding cassette subfamily B protein
LRASIKNADDIVVLSTRGIEEQGTHAELMEKGGVYASLYQEGFTE